MYLVWDLCCSKFSAIVKEVSIFGANTPETLLVRKWLPLMVIRGNSWGFSLMYAPPESRLSLSMEMWHPQTIAKSHLSVWNWQRRKFKFILHCKWKKMDYMNVMFLLMKVMLAMIRIIWIWNESYHYKMAFGLQCLPQCGLFSPFVRTARFWVTEWGNQILTNMNIVGIDMLYKPQ